MPGSYFVSICIPAYNQTVFLKKTLDSIALQTYTNFEVILTDDSTTVDVYELTQQYTSKFKLHYHKNAASLGSPANWNKAISLAKGDLIKFIHHDDWFSGPDSLFEFVEAFEKNKDADLVFCTTEILNVSENTIAYNRPPAAFLARIKQNPKTLYNDNRIGSPTAIMYRKNNELFDEKIKYVVDVEFYIRLLSKNKNFVFIDKPLIVNTSNHAGQVTAASLNKATQVGEYTYLYNKLYKNKLPGVELTRFFISLFKKYDVKSLNDKEAFYIQVPQPAWYFRLLLFISKYIY